MTIQIDGMFVNIGGHLKVLIIIWAKKLYFEQGYELLPIKAWHAQNFKSNSNFWIDFQTF